MAARTEAAQQTFQVGLDQMANHLERQLEERLAGLAADQHRRMAEVENRIVELQNSARRSDEQSSAIIQHINASGRHTDDAMIAVHTRVSQQAAAVEARIADSESANVDRTRSLEERMTQQTLAQLSGVEAMIGRVDAGLGEATAALTNRIVDLRRDHDALAARVEGIAASIGDLVGTIADHSATIADHSATITDHGATITDHGATIAKVDPDAVDELREQMSGAVGESMLVRIELERVASSTSEKFDKFSVRLAELAADIADSTFDVSTAVQLERLEEIERALLELDPDQFVRKAEVAGDDGGPGVATPTSPAHGDSSASSLSSW